MLNFKSYKKFYFHCLANAELKYYTKVLKNLFHDMTLKKHIWPLYYHHTLAAGKLINIDLKCTIIMPLMWDNVTKINCNIFEWVWLLKNLFFSNVYISLNTIFECCYLFSVWEIGHPLSTGSSQMCTCPYRESGVEKLVIRYVRTKWMAPNKCCGTFFVHWFGQVYQSITASKKNVIVFFHHNYDYFILCDN